MTTKTFDAIIIGGGHMGLTLGAYLQRSGMKTAIFERRHEEGSAIFTSECTAPGFLHNLHAQYMEFMDWMPAWYDFDLPKFGARCIYPEAQSGIAFSDGRPPIVLYSMEHRDNFERTHKSIAAYSKKDADTFVRMLNIFKDMESFVPVSLYNPPTQPTPDNPDPGLESSKMLSELLDIPLFLRNSSPRDVIDYLFETPELRMLLYRMSVEWSTPVEQMGLGFRAIGLFGIYFNWRLMVGGTHTLAHALEMAGVNEGMEMYESSEVVKILVKNGKATGVQLKDGTEIQATKLVASNADLKATLLNMVGEDNLSPLWVKRAKDFKIGPSSVLASTALALHEAPDYKSARHNPDINKTFYTVVGYDTPEEVLEYCNDAENGRIPRIPGAGTWVNSLWDPTYAPAGKHSLTGWFFFPKAGTQTRQEWEEVRATYNDRFIKQFTKFAPNMTWDNVIDHYFYTPLDQEDEMRLMEGDFFNGAVRLDQMGPNQPFPEASQYRTEIENLYLCGPYMFPGGGASGATGYNCFKRIAEDFGLEKFWEATGRGY
ncbi:MAG: NAD(P)/FAD-dependent oxidoreductase [Proteobacteria bacterium]|nr:NAD(P)/FAD-dependent oxidoreductase [Pseudomonadota bacterium]